MKRITIFSTIAAMMLSLPAIASAADITIFDNYYGGEDWQDPATFPPDGIREGVDQLGVTFGIEKMEVTFGSTVQVDIYSSYLTRFVNGEGTVSTTLGDLFISDDDWSPFGSAADFYNKDVRANGEDWEYALVIENGPAPVPQGSATTVFGGSLSLYDVEDANIIESSGLLTPVGYRKGHEILYDTTNDSPYQANVGTWTADYGAGLLSFSFDNTTLGLNIDDFALRWTMTCANDIIEGGSSEVPEPATMVLFGAGLFGLAGSAIRRKRK